MLFFLVVLSLWTESFSSPVFLGVSWVFWALPKQGNEECHHPQQALGDAENGPYSCSPRRDYVIFYGTLESVDSLYVPIVLPYPGSFAGFSAARSLHLNTRQARNVLGNECQ